MKTNKKTKTQKITNHNGLKVAKETAEKELERTVGCLMLFEDTFYETGTDIAKRMETLVNSCRVEFVCDLAIKARKDLKLRHAPLYLMVLALRMEGTPSQRNLIGNTISQIISRADELAEIISIYWKVNPNAPLPRQLKAGVAKAFPKFNEYSLAKYNGGEKEVKLRDAMFLTHPKPVDKDMEKLWKKLIDDKMDVPMTWEVMLSSGKDKAKTFTKLLKEEKLGYLALLKNLRNISESGVNEDLVTEALMAGAKNSVALPFRFITAAKYAPQYSNTLSDAMVASLENHPKLLGKTAILVDISGSMDALLTSKSEMTRIGAASAMAMLLVEVSNTKVYAFSDNCHEVKKGKGFKLIDNIWNACGHGGTHMGRAIRHVYTENPEIDRIIIVTDEQSQDSIPHLPSGMKGYIVNVAPNAPALPTYDGIYTRFSGFSERIIDWIIAEEKK